MAIDPVRPLRTAYLQQLLGIIRQSRQSILRNVRPLIISPYPLDLDELERMIERSLTYHLDRRGQAIVEMFIRLGYDRGVDYTVGRVQALAPVSDFKIIAGVDFTRPDMKAIDELSRLSLADLKGINADLGRKVLRTIVEGDKKGLGVTRNRPGDHRTVQHHRPPQGGDDRQDLDQPGIQQGSLGADREVCPLQDLDRYRG